MILTSGTKYDLSIECEGYSELTSSFEIPDKKGEFELKQIIKLQKTGTQKTIKVNNYFTEAEAAKISFDVPVAKPTSTLTSKIVSKPKKAKRSIEEAEKDKEDLKMAEFIRPRSLSRSCLVYQNLELYIDLEPTDEYRYGVSLFKTKKIKHNVLLHLNRA